MRIVKTAQRAAVAVVATIGVSGCVVSIEDNDPGTAEAVPPPPLPMICNAEKAQYHLGHNATQSMGEAVLKDSGARSLRWGPPGGAWTMDYREDRVNVRYDANMKITEVTCG